MKLFRAFYDSRNFSFEAYGSSKDDAINQLIKGLKIHAKEYQIPNEDWYTEDDFSVYEIFPNTAYRDCTELKGKTLKDFDISDIYQNFTPSEKDFPLELMEHLCNMNDILLTDNIIYLIKSVYAETKYRVLMEALAT
jgi:hypothetical protein